TGASASEAPAATTQTARPSRNGPGRGPRTDRGTDTGGTAVVDEPVGEDSALADATSPTTAEGSDAGQASEDGGDPGGTASDQSGTEQREGGSGGHERTAVMDRPRDRRPSREDRRRQREERRQREREEREQELADAPIRTGILD